MSATANTALFHGHITHARRRAVVVCSGEIDLSGAAAFRALLDQAIDASRDVVVDLSDVSFLDSSGLRVMIIASQNAARSLTIRNPAPSVARVLELSGIDQVIKVHTGGRD